MVSSILKNELLDLFKRTNTAKMITLHHKFVKRAGIRREALG